MPKKLIFLVFLISPIACQQFSPNLKYQEKWGYLPVKEHGQMFWWLYYQKETTVMGNQRPLVMWLQGGPGGGSSGFGNFGEVGPLDVSLASRNATWVQLADMLFVDQPVGSGYSYVTEDSAFTTNVDEIADDLLNFTVQWLKQYPRYRNRQFHIWSESYGGKMATVFAKRLYKAIHAGDVQLDFHGIVLGDSWISGIDYTRSWAPYLLSLSFIDLNGFERLDNGSAQCQRLIDQGKWFEANDCWDHMESLVQQIAYPVNFYNVLYPYNKKADGQPEHWVLKNHRSVEYDDFPMDFINQLMNGEILREKLHIPENVTFGGQSGMVLYHQRGDFMKPVIETVDWLLSNTNLSITVVNGQLDLICDILGTEMWISKLKWPDLKKYHNAQRSTFTDKVGKPAGYKKAYGHFQLYWVMNAGHMLPYDQPDASLEVFNRIISA